MERCCRCRSAKCASATVTMFFGRRLNLETSHVEVVRCYFCRLCIIEEVVVACAVFVDGDLVLESERERDRDVQGVYSG
jgi:hypothetical protein